MRKSVLIFFFIFQSCTTVHFRSSGQIPIHLSPKKGHGSIQEFHGEKKFYLWGLLPQNHTVDVSEVARNLGYSSSANIFISEYQTIPNFFITMLSLGMYIPRNYSVKAYGELRYD